MRLVRVDRIGNGMELARDVPSAALASTPLLRRGVRLSSGVGATLERRGVRAVWIEDDLGEGIVPVQPLPEEVRRSAERAVITCLDGARDAEATPTATRSGWRRSGSSSVTASSAWTAGSTGAASAGSTASPRG